MRELNIELAGHNLRMVANFSASMQIAKQVGDPMTIMREAALEVNFIGMGIPYDPKWRFTISNIPLIIEIGIKEAGGKMALKEIQELCFEAGFAAARDVAVEYLSLIAGPKPEETLESDGEPAGE